MNKPKQYNLIELIKDDRGLEMLMSFKPVDNNNVIHCYNQLLEYVNREGLQEAYNQYLTMRDKKK